MNLAISAAHIFGALFTLAILTIVSVAIAAWDISRIEKKMLESLALKLGVQADQLNKDELQPKIREIIVERASDELLRNRLSDLCGWLQAAWSWLFILLQAGTIGAAVWLAITEGSSGAEVAWFAVPLAMFGWAVGTIFVLLCRLLTGRSPGEARRIRRSLASMPAAR